MALILDDPQRQELTELAAFGRLYDETAHDAGAAAWTDLPESERIAILAALVRHRLDQRRTDPLLTAQAVAHELGVDSDTVVAMFKDGRLCGAFKAGQRLWRIRESDYHRSLEALIEMQRQKVRR